MFVKPLFAHPQSNGEIRIAHASGHDKIGRSRQLSATTFFNAENAGYCVAI